MNKRIDVFVDRRLGRRRVEDEGAVNRVGDVFFDEAGTKWLVVFAEPEAKGWAYDIDEIEPFNIFRHARRAFVWFVVSIFAVASVAVPLYLLFWRNE